MTLDLDPRILRTNNPNFEAKLSFAERCAILALYRREVSPRAIAAAFGVNRRTVAKITTPDANRYQAVRDEEKLLGSEAFQAKYITESIVARINAAAELPEVTEDAATYDSAPKAARAGIPSMRANGHAGITGVKLPHHEYTHRIEVKWHEADTLNDTAHPAGWYWRDLDEDESFWQGDPDNDTHVTSAKALTHAKVTI